MIQKKRIDTRGLLCPAPLIAVRKEIKAAEVGDEIEVLTDNDVAYSNLINYLSELSIATNCTKQDFVHTISFTKPDITPSEGDLHCSIATAPSSYTVVVKSETMGEGDPKLGTLLLRGYLNALLELDKLPEHIVMYNSGVKCAIEGSDTALTLEKLESKGVSIIICGTCTDFYGLQDKISIGVISNMYKIAEVTSQAPLVVYP